MHRKSVAVATVMALGVILANNAPLAAQSRITYVPPKQEREKPQETQSSATRGCRKDLTGLVTLLAPREHVGLTGAARPVLFYHLSRKLEIRALLTLAEIDGRSAILEQPIALNQPGIQSFHLPEKIELETNQEYLWTITLVCNPVRPSEGIEVQAVLKRVALSPALERQLGQAASPRERSRLYAQSGIWYEALANLFPQVGRKKASTDFQDLLGQIGLSYLSGDESGKKNQELPNSPKASENQE